MNKKMTKCDKCSLNVQKSNLTDKLISMCSECDTDEAIIINVGKNRSELVNRLRTLMNSMSLEEGSDTPDFALAEYLVDCLNSYEKVVRARDNFHGGTEPFSKFIARTKPEQKLLSPIHIPGITYVTGDATEPIDDGSINQVIVHVCNDIGKWGRGFVLALSKKWLEPEAEYKKLFYSDKDLTDILGYKQIVPVQKEKQPYVFVSNMIAQHGIAGMNRKAPIRYDALRKALASTVEVIKNTAGKTTMHMPKIGAGLAGGNWEEIEQIIKEEVITHGIPVIVYTLPEKSYV